MNAAELRRVDLGLRLHRRQSEPLCRVGRTREAPTEGSLDAPLESAIWDGTLFGMRTSISGLKRCATRLDRRKPLGLTISLEIGYRLSAKGEALTRGIAPGEINI
jgi:hypothetical protein